MEARDDKISDALEHLALTLGTSGAVPIPELVRSLERAAERLRTRTGVSAAPTDLVTQAEASRTIGVSRQAVNQWVRKGALRTYTTPERNGALVSLSEVSVAANRRAPVQFSSNRRRELIGFLDLLADSTRDSPAADLRDSLDGDQTTGHIDESRVLSEFVIAAMDTGDRQQEFTAEGVRLLFELTPQFVIDVDAPFGSAAQSLGLLVSSSDGASGFDSATTAILGLLGVATVGSQFEADSGGVASSIAAAAAEVWGGEWTARMYEAAYNVGEQRPSPLTRYTASLTYLDNHRFLRQAQSAGVSIAYSRGAGPLLPQRFYGAPIHHDILSGDHVNTPVWGFTPAAAAATGPPANNPSAVNPFRVFNYEFGLLDSSIHGIRRYCFSATDAGAELRATATSLSRSQRQAYVQTAVDTLARTIEAPYVELAAIDSYTDFDWWKDHIIRSSKREILIGLRNEDARRVAHAILVQTSMLTDVVGAADSDGSLRDRLRIYVKNLEFDVVEARYQDDLRRGVTRLIKPGGITLTHDEAVELAESEIHTYLQG